MIHSLSLQMHLMPQTLFDANYAKDSINFIIVSILS